MVLYFVKQTLPSTFPQHFSPETIFNLITKKRTSGELLKIGERPNDERTEGSKTAFKRNHKGFCTIEMTNYIYLLFIRLHRVSGKSCQE